MQKENVEDLKSEVFRRFFGFSEIPLASLSGNGPLFAPTAGTEAFDEIGFARKNKKRDPRDQIAIGVLPPGGNADPSGYELAIFVQQKRYIQHPIVEKAVRAAKGEAQIIVTGPVHKLGGVNIKRCRPLMIGASIGHYRSTAGTLGCFVQCRTNGGIGILSNNHVLADLNRAKPGDDILQPGRADGGRRAEGNDCVARLYRFIPISFDIRQANIVDCAFAILNDGIEKNSTIVQPSTAPSWRLGTPTDILFPRDVVKKFGRTSEFTDGYIAATDVDNVVVSMSAGDPTKSARFDRQIAIGASDSAFSKPGDSGSLVFNDENQPIGLLFAGTQSGGENGRGITYSNPINTVLDQLDVNIHV